MAGVRPDNEIAGAFGTINVHDAGPRRGLRARLLTLLAIIGPGLIVMVGDNDAGGVSTYVQAGQQFGYSLLWTLPLLIPVLIVNQEMVARLGAVTGVGHGRLIRERIGRRWGNVSIGTILVLNFLIVVTEFIGISYAMQYLGVSEYISIPIAAVTLFLVTATGSFRRWERFMMLFVAVNFVVVPLVVLTHPSFSAVAAHVAVPGVRGGVTSESVLLIISIIGTTVAPWQLFFQESNIVDKRISPRWLNYERADTMIGSVVVVIGAGALVIAAATISTRSVVGARWTTLVFAHDVGHLVGHTAGVLFAIVLLNAAVLGAAVVTLASSYALGDLKPQSRGLDSTIREAPGFYGAFGGLLAAAAVITLVPHTPLGLVTLIVQAMCGMLLPSTTIFVMILANDAEMLGPWVNARWLNLLAAVIIVVLAVLSIVLMLSTVFPSIDVVRALTVVGGAGALGLVVGVPIWWRRAGPRPVYDGDRRDWRTPRLALATPPVTSRARRWLYRSQASYLTVAAVLLVVRFIQLAVK